MKPDQEMVNRVRSQIRETMHHPIVPEQVMQMLFSIRLKDYCLFLSQQQPVDDTDYMEVYRLLLQYSKLETRSGKGSIADKPLTVGWMVLKGQDMIYYEQEYADIWDPVTMKSIKPRFVGEYIVDMLLVRPLRLMMPEQKPQPEPEEVFPDILDWEDFEDVELPF